MADFKATKIIDASNGSQVSIGPRVQTPSGNVMQVQIGPGDIISNLPVIVDFAHHQIHEGEAFNYRNFTTLSSGQTLNISFSPSGTSTSAATSPHLLFDIEGTTQTELRFWEGATLSGGTIISGLNNNRALNGAYKTIIRTGVTISGSSPSSGLLLEAHSKGLEGATPVAGKSTGMITRDDEWIIKPGSVYLMEIKSVGANNVIDYSIKWYEDLGV